MKLKRGQYVSFHDAWVCTDALVMEADDASACLQAPSSDCWSINGAVSDLRDKLENTALGGNMLMRIITASAELSRSARKQKRCTDGRDTPAVARASKKTFQFARNGPAVLSEHLPLKSKTHSWRRCSRQFLWLRKTGIKLPGSPPFNEKTASGLLGRFSRASFSGGRQETNRIGSAKLLRHNQGFYCPSVHFSKAAH